MRTEAMQRPPTLAAFSYVHTFRHAAELAPRIGNCGVTLDIAHRYWGPCQLGDRSDGAGAVAVVHRSNPDAPALLRRDPARCTQGPSDRLDTSAWRQGARTQRPMVVDRPAVDMNRRRKEHRASLRLPC
jgi:hypothetical protein